MNAKTKSETAQPQDGPVKELVDALDAIREKPFDEGKLGFSKH